MPAPAHHEPPASQDRSADSTDHRLNTQLSRPLLSRRSRPLAGRCRLAVSPRSPQTLAWPKFTDVTEAAGIKFKHSLGDFEMSNIAEATGPGCCIFDYDNDGFMDIYFVNGRWHPDISDNRGRTLKGKLKNALYHNNGNGTFTDVTDKAGVGGYEDSYGMAASCADYDNDGYLDLYVCNYGKSILYRNNGDGTFTDVTEKAGLASPGWALAAPWFDYNGDGLLDVFVVHYLEYDKGAFQRTGAYYKADNFPGPLSYPGQPDHLYRNNGDGTFTDVTKEVGPVGTDGPRHGRGGLRPGRRRRHRHLRHQRRHGQQPLDQRRQGALQGHGHRDRHGLRRRRAGGVLDGAVRGRRGPQRPARHPGAGHGLQLADAPGQARASSWTSPRNPAWRCSAANTPAGAAC